MGNLLPSETRALVGMSLLDHIIVTDWGHRSFRETEGWDPQDT